MSRRLQAKFGSCDRYRSPKLKYWKRVVAEFDCAKLNAQDNCKVFNVFRCGACRHWHIGSQ